LGAKETYEIDIVHALDPSANGKIILQTLSIGRAKIYNQVRFPVTASSTNAEAQYGTDEDFKKLVETLHEKGGFAAIPIGFPFSIAHEVVCMLPATEIRGAQRSKSVIPFQRTVYTYHILSLYI
jgi:tryptophan synthase alpha subunit